VIWEDARQDRFNVVLLNIEPTNKPFQYFARRIQQKEGRQLSKEARDTIVQLGIFFGRLCKVQ
jgi:hypothetical protein